jgi:hypothetical protein
MSQPHHKNKKTGERLPPFAPIFKQEMDSTAFKELSASAVKGLIFFRWAHGIVKKRTGNPNSAFDFTYTEAEKYGFARRTFSRVVKELSDKGFIDIVNQGGMRGNGKSNSTYKMSSRWALYGMCSFIKKPRYPCEP